MLPLILIFGVGGWHVRDGIYLGVGVRLHDSSHGGLAALAETGISDECDIRFLMGMVVVLVFRFIVEIRTQNLRLGWTRAPAGRNDAAGS
jgi:hypothetical protein